MKFSTSLIQNSLLSVIAASVVVIAIQMKDISETIGTGASPLVNTNQQTTQQMASLGSNADLTKEKELDKESSSNEVTTEDPFEALIQKRIDEMALMKTKGEAMTPEPTSASQSLVDKGPDRSCYVNIGNYSQPKFAYDKDCNPLPQEMTEKKISLTLNKLPEPLTVNFKAENESRVVYVFTDYTCPFCKKLHSKIDEFNERGITVKYLQYPRILNSSPGSLQAKTVMANMESAWCAPDHRVAFGNLYHNGYVDEYECKKENNRINPPMREHFALAKQIELKYTPTVVSQDGKVSYGFSSVSRTLRDLEY